MARFRPGDLFRRLSTTRGDHSNTATTTANPTDASPSPHDRRNSPPSAPLPRAIPSSSAASPKSVRKSTSLPRLRRRFLRNPTSDVQEAVKEEWKDSLLPVQDGSLSILEAEVVSPNPPSEPSTPHQTSPKSVSLDGDKTTAKTSAEDLQLEGLRKLPVVVLQQATPEVAETEVRDVEPASVEYRSQLDTVELN